MKKWSSEKTASAALFVALIILAGVGYSSWRSINLLLENGHEIERTYKLLNKLEKVFSLLKDSESAQRGYAITGESQYLAPLEAAEKEIPSLFAEIAEELVHDDIQRKRFAELKPVFDEKMNWIRELVALRKTAKAEEVYAQITSDHGLQLMEEVREVINKIAGDVGRELARRATTAQARASDTLRTSTLSLSLHFVLLLVVSYLVRQELSTRHRAEAAMEKARDAALQSARMKSEFLANMSHEIRTPMNGVIGMLNLLLDTKLDGEQKIRAKTARESAESLLTILNDILDFSKIEAGKLNFEMTSFSLRETVESAVEMLATKAQEKKIELACLVYADVPDKLQGDPSRLRQVLVNLLSNGIKFTQAGEVVIRVRKLSQAGSRCELCFSVTDTGMGIPKEVQEKLFTPFTQADSSTTREFGGTGLGLAISKQLVEGMKGKMAVKSSPGVGSEFSFTAHFDLQANQNEGSKGQFLVGKRAFIVDDNQTNREILQAQLGSWGMVVEEARSAEEGLEKLMRNGQNSQKPDVILLDLQMPGMSGLDLARKILASFPEYPPMGLLTSAGVHDPKVLKSAGFSFWLAKPIKQSALFDSLATALNSEITGNNGSAAAPVPRRPDPLPASEIPQFGPLKILLVEDNRVNQMVALGTLEKLGYRADVAGNGLEAIQAVKSIPYDLLFMDCQMPEMDGYEATRQIRELEMTSARKRVLIIAMTANAMQGDREKCLAAGMDDYLSKPFKAIDFRNLLQKHASMGRKEGETGGSVLGKKALADLQELNTPDRPGTMDEIFRMFLEDAPPMVVRIQRGAAEKDAGEIERFAHKLAGSASIFGASELIEHCREIQKSARSGNWPDAVSKAAAVEEAFASVRAEMESRMAG